jgi:hypothetical protein
MTAFLRHYISASPRLSHGSSQIHQPVQTHRLLIDTPSKCLYYSPCWHSCLSSSTSSANPFSDSSLLKVSQVYPPTPIPYPSLAISRNSVQQSRQQEEQVHSSTKLLVISVHSLKFVSASSQSGSKSPNILYTSILNVK